MGTLFRRAVPDMRTQVREVSIPPEMGTLFRHEEILPGDVIILSQYPLRWAPSSDQIDVEELLDAQLSQL
jgi:hypothetical protein